MKHFTVTQVHVVPWFSDHDAFDTLLLWSSCFYCAVGILAMILSVLFKISERSEIAAEWNGGLTHY